MAPVSILLVLVANVLTTSASPVRGRKAREVGYVGMEIQHEKVDSAVTQGYVSKAAYEPEAESISDDAHPIIVDKIHFPELSQAQLQDLQQAQESSSLPSFSTLAFIFCIAGFAAILYRSTKTDKKGSGMQDSPYVQEALAALSGGLGPFSNFVMNSAVQARNAADRWNNGEKAVPLFTAGEMSNSGLLDESEFEDNADSQVVSDASVGFFAEDEVQPEVPPALVPCANLMDGFD